MSFYVPLQLNANGQSLSGFHDVLCETKFFGGDKILQNAHICLQGEVCGQVV